MTDLIDIFAPIETEGTTSVLSNWLVSKGDAISEGAPLLELETDKVAVEVPAPCAGILAEIILTEGADVAPGALLARLARGVAHSDAAQPRASTRHSPAVRRILAEAGLTGDEINGTGRDGRITKADALDFLAARPAPQPAPAPLPATAPPVMPAAAPASAGRSRMEPHSAMRRSIARHMSESLATAPHVTAIFEADFSAIMAHRRAHKAAFEAKGIKLTFTAYFIAAAVEAMRAAPAVNSRWHDDAIEIIEDINIGIGTALGDEGLIVPVVHGAQALSLEGIAARLGDITQRARARQLAPQDTRGGTFTISNHGTSGSLLAAPIVINQPQSAILGIGKLEKRVCVIETDAGDAIQIRPKAYVSLSIDHRVIDGHQTNAWLSRFVACLEGWPAQ